VSGSEDLELEPEKVFFDVGSGEVYNGAVRVRREAYEHTGQETIRFTITADDDPNLSASAESRFFAPTR
jgi:hypothetical protein